jgi:SAM-dependent methyltransferase
MIHAPEAACACGGVDYRALRSEGIYQRGKVTNYAYRLYSCQLCALTRTSPVPNQGIYDGLDIGDGDARPRPWLADTASEVAGEIRGYLPGAVRLLDVGCNSGEMVASLASAGWDARGCDIDPQAVGLGRRAGRDLFVANPETGPLEGSYDAVTLIHTLEHVLDLSAVLSNVAVALERGGLLHIRVPNYGGLLPLLMGNGWGFLVPYQHVWQFTPSTLRDVVLRTGVYQPLRVSANTQLEPASIGVKGVAKRGLGALGRRIERGDELRAMFRRA